MKILKSFLIAALATAFWFHGRYYRPEPPLAEVLQIAFESGEHFTDGWNAAQGAYGIHWEEGKGWICDRCESSEEKDSHRQDDRTRNYNYDREHKRIVAKVRKEALEIRRTLDAAKKK